MSDYAVDNERSGFSVGDVLFWMAAAVVLFWGLGARGLWTAEGRWAEIAREMLINKDLFHPNINGEPYFDKPLLSYWLIVMTAPLTGMNEWALRIPSAICGVLGLWATRVVCRTLWTVSVARLAGWMLLTCYGFLFWGRTGEADMANLAFIMLAVAWYWVRRERPNFVTYVVFYVLLFAGAQMKGLTALIIPALVVFPDLLVEKRWKYLFSWAHVGALLIGLLVYFVPFFFSAMTRGDYESSGLSLVFRENVQRFFDPFDHVEPFYAYFEHVPVLFLPWSPVLLVGLLSLLFSVRRKAYSWRTYWLGLACLLIFLFFSASGSRRSYYILPILPFCAMFTALFLLSPNRYRWQRVAYGIQTAISMLLIALGLIAGAAYPLAASRFGVTLPTVRIALLLMSCTALIPWVLMWLGVEWLGRVLQLHRRFVPPLLTTLIFMGGYFCVLQPALEPFRTEKQFGLDVKATNRAVGDVAFYQHRLENVVFYLSMTEKNQFHPVIDDSAAALAFLREDPDHVIILRRRALDNMLQVFPEAEKGEEAVEETMFDWEKDKKIQKKMVAWRLPSAAGETSP